MADDKVCTVVECCDPPVTCLNNNGDVQGLTSSAFVGCEDPKYGGLAGYTLKSASELAASSCNSNGKKCTAGICCNPPVYCSNNDGSRAGVTGSAFHKDSCKSENYGGFAGYILKTLTSLSGASCGQDRKCTASECCNLITCDVNNGRHTGVK